MNLVLKIKFNFKNWQCQLKSNTFADLGPLPDVTKVNKSDNIELRCTTRGAMIKFRTVWHKTGSEISLSNKTALYLRNVTYTDTGSYVCFVHYQSCNANNISNTKNNLTKTTYVDVQGNQYDVKRRSYKKSWNCVFINFVYAFFSYRNTTVFHNFRLPFLWYTRKRYVCTVKVYSYLIFILKTK